MTIKTYSELIKLPTFEERYRYLKLDGKVGEATFGYDRYLNQKLYQRSIRYKSARAKVIVRDLGCDLGIEDRTIPGMIFVHHITPITKEDILYDRDCLYDPENLICTSDRTHKAIHYGDESLLVATKLIERTRHDTCPWRRN